MNTTFKRLVLPLATSMLFAGQAHAQSKGATKEFCLVSPSAVDVESSKRTAGSVSLLGGVIGGASVDRDVTERRTTNISDDSLKTKREQYAIQCNYEIKNAKNDEERIAIANKLFAEWFPELGPRPQQAQTTIDITSISQSPVALNPPTLVPSSNAEIPPSQETPGQSVDPNSAQTFQGYFNVSSVDTTGNTAATERNRMMLGLANFAQAQVPDDITSVKQYKFTCEILNDTIYASIRGLDRSIFDKRHPRDWERDKSKKNELISTDTYFYAVTAIMNANQLLFKNFRTNYWSPTTAGWAFAIQTDTPSLETKGKECLVLLFKKFR